MEAETPMQMQNDTLCSVFLSALFDFSSHSAKLMLSPVVSRKRGKKESQEGESLHHLKQLKEQQQQQKSVGLN
jgi:hypothetical protein